MIQYNLSTTGDCQNYGTGGASIIINSEGSVPPYKFDWNIPNLGVDYSLTSSTRNNLYSGNYTVFVTDSNIPTNNTEIVTITISSGFCVSILNTNNTTCNFSNGSVTAETQSTGKIIYNLYTSNNELLNTIGSGTYGIFDSMSAGTYYIMAFDLGGCSAKTESFLINESPSFDFGLYTVPNSGCNNEPSGKIFVTGQTYGAPYTYLWNNLETTNSITGLTNGLYTVQVTNAYGCTISKSATIDTVPYISQKLLNIVSPSCFGSNGEIHLSISGGTPPYYYSASTGDFEVSYSDTFSLSGLNAGQYAFLVTDAGFCTFQTSTLLETPNSISTLSIETTNSSCSSVGGSILLKINGGVYPYTYSIVYPNGNTFTNSSSQTSYLFDNLVAGIYTVGVEDANNCGKTQEVSILTQDKYTVSTQVTSTPSGTNNGVILVEISDTAVPPYTYYIDDTITYPNTILTAVTFNNLPSGQHSVSVTDYDGCKITKQVVITELPKVNFYLSPKSAGSGNEGQITAFISTGTPPFQFNWSDNIPNNPQHITVTGLTAGTYSLVVVDSNNSTQLRTVDVPKINRINTYEVYTMGEQQVLLNTQGKYSLSKMLNEGYDDITSGHTGCQLESANFIAKVNVQPYNFETTNTFFTTNSLLVSPEDNLWYDTAEQLLLSVQGVSNVIIDELNNKFTVEGDLNQPNIIGGTNPISISLSLSIEYDISCIV